MYAPTMAHENPRNPDLQSAEKKVLESRLENFLERLDGYDSQTQNLLYEILEERIQERLWSYEIDSKPYIVLELVSDVVTHKIDETNTLSNMQILWHVLYAQEYDVAVEDDVQEAIIEIEEIQEDDYDYTQELNEYEKDILAGEKAGVVSYGIRTGLESIDVETVEFHFNQNVDDIGLQGKIYLNGEFVAGAIASDIDGTIMTFDNIPDLRIPKSTVYLQLVLYPEHIGKDSIGAVKENLVITRVILKDTKGVTTGDKTGNKTYTEDSKAFNIVPVKLLVSVEAEFQKHQSTSELKIIPQRGSNTDNGNDLNAYLSEIDIRVSALDESGDIFIFNSNNALIGTASITSSWTITVVLTPDVISQRGEVYTFQTTAKGIFSIPQDGIRYSAGGYNLESKLWERINIWQR